MMTIEEARRTIKQAFADDPNFRQGYIDNVAMTIHDNGLTDCEARNKAADQIIKLLFEDEIGE